MPALRSRIRALARRQELRRGDSAQDG